MSSITTAATPWACTTLTACSTTRPCLRRWLRGAGCTVRNKRGCLRARPPAAASAAGGGVRVVRPWLLKSRATAACERLARQYMLGPSLLVAPVFSAESDVSYYVPAGRWTHLLTGQVIEGPGWRRETHGFMSLPLLVRPDTVLALGAHDDCPDYNYADGVTLRVYELSNGATATAVVPNLDGSTAATFVARREVQSITIERAGAAKAWRVEVGGNVVTAEAGTERVEVSVK